MFGGDLVDGDGVADRARNQIDVVPCQPTVGMSVATYASLDVRESRKDREVIPMVLQRFVGGSDGVIWAGIFGEPFVLADRASP